ncbi:MAG TPA: hypothetical protein VLL08_18590, partial [Kineosporiaceae bacterium]|nr:hypothetical protein [Kineosporiaceae bacterium]
MLANNRKRPHRWLYSSAAVAALIVPSVASALPAQAASAPVAGSTYQLAVAKSGQCLDVAGGSTGNGGLLQ